MIAVRGPDTLGTSQLAWVAIPPGVPLLLGPPGPTFVLVPTRNFTAVGGPDVGNEYMNGSRPGPREYSESRSSAGLRMLLMVFASVSAVSDEEMSNVMS